MELEKSILMLCILLGLIITITKANEDECSCGITNPSRIVGGVDAKENEFTSMVALVYIPKNNIFCGGTIITEKYILTAAHCLEVIEGLSKYTAVVLNKGNLQQNNLEDGDWYEIKKLIIHPEYNFLAHENDIGFIVTSEDIKFSMKVSPACLPFYYSQKDFEGETVTMAGWGKMKYENSETSNTLKKVDVKVINNEECSKHYNKIRSGMLCTYTEGKDSCTNDSGGPVYWQNATSNHLMIIGVISFGKKCADVHPGVSMRVTSYLNYIQSVIRADCVTHRWSIGHSWTFSKTLTTFFFMYTFILQIINFARYIEKRAIQ